MHHVSLKSGGGLTPHYCSPLSASRPWADPRLHHFMIQFLHWRLYSDDNYSPGAGGVWSRSTARYITTGDPQLSCPLLILHLFNNFYVVVYYEFYLFSFLRLLAFFCVWFVEDRMFGLWILWNQCKVDSLSLSFIHKLPLTLIIGQ